MIAGGGERSQAEGSDCRQREMIAPEGKRSMKGSDSTAIVVREAITGGGKRSQVDGLIDEGKRSDCYGLKRLAIAGGGEQL